MIIKIFFFLSDMAHKTKQNKKDVFFIYFLGANRNMNIHSPTPSLVYINLNPTIKPIKKRPIFLSSHLNGSPSNTHLPSHRHLPCIQALPTPKIQAPTRPSSMANRWKPL